MDYRLSGVLEDCKYKGASAGRSAQAYRDQSNGSDEVDHAREVLIAKQQGIQQAYEYVAAQLESFTFDEPGGSVPEKAPPLSTSAGGGLDCDGCLSNAEQVQDIWDDVKSKGTYYGWTSYECEQRRRDLDGALKTLVRDLRTHK